MLAVTINNGVIDLRYQIFVDFDLGRSLVDGYRGIGVLTLTPDIVEVGDPHKEQEDSEHEAGKIQPADDVEDCGGEQEEEEFFLQIGVQVQLLVNYTDSRHCSKGSGRLSYIFNLLGEGDHDDIGQDHRQGKSGSPIEDSHHDIVSALGRGSDGGDEVSGPVGERNEGGSCHCWSVRGIGLYISLRWLWRGKSRKCTGAV